jgi:D-xylono/L-arabinono-1,4-lactonase
MTPELLVNTHDSTGENPLWDEKRAVLYWVDIPHGEIYEYTPATGAHRLLHRGQECGAFALQSDGNLLLLYSGTAGLLNPVTGELTHLKSDVVSDTGRFNDCLADPKGRLFAGTVDWEQQTRGALFRLDHDLNATTVFQGTACSNGMAFAPGLKQLYWADSTAKTVSLFDYDEESGELSNKRVWLSTPGETPDGLTIDSDGNLWIAFFDTACVRHYSPQAELLQQVDVSAKHVTSCHFGGAQRDELYITTAGGKDGADNTDGALFRLKLPVGGGPEFPSRVLVSENES